MSKEQSTVPSQANSSFKAPQNYRAPFSELAPTHNSSFVTTASMQDSQKVSQSYQSQVCNFSKENIAKKLDKKSGMSTRLQSNRKIETPSPISKLFPAVNSGSMVNTVANSETTGLRDGSTVKGKPSSSEVFNQPSVAQTTAEKTVDGRKMNSSA